MNIGIIGLGLIGGSLGKALIKKTDNFVYGTDIDNDVLVKAELTNAVNAPLTADDYSKLDLLIVALMPSQVYSVVLNVADKLKDGCIIIDICGNKTQIVKDFERLSSAYPALQFIATHPMAGKEFSGINYSSSSLFERASILLMPVNAEIETVANFKKLCYQIGFEFVKITSADEHDRLIAYTSQLAHIISSAYINSPLAEFHDGFSAGSFKDMSRVSRMNPAMWTELLKGNKDNILDALNVFLGNITQIRDCINADDYGRLTDILALGNLKKETVDKASREWKRENSEK